MKAWIAIGMTLCLLLAGALPVYAAPAEGAEEVYVLSAGEAAALTMDVEVPEAGLYQIGLTWRSIADQATEYVVGIQANGGEVRQAALPPDVARRGRRIRGSAGQ